MTTEADHSYELELKNRFYKGQQWTIRVNSFGNAYVQTKDLPDDKKRAAILECFELYKCELCCLIEDGVIDLNKLLIGIPVRQRVSLIKEQMEECIIKPSAEEAHIRRWLY